MQTQNLPLLTPTSPPPAQGQSTSNSPSKLHSYPKPDREPVKILVIGSKQSVTAIVVALHQLGFAEIFEMDRFSVGP